MENFGMELHAPHLFAFYLISGNLHLVGRGDDFEVGGDGRNGVSVAHPYLRMFAHVLEQRILPVKRLQMGTSILTRAGRLYRASIAVSDELRPVTNAQDGILAADAAQVYLKSARVVHREGATGQDDPFHAIIVFRKFVVGNNFTIDIQFANAPSDELRGLRTEVENDNLFLHITTFEMNTYNN